MCSKMDKPLLACVDGKTGLIPSTARLEHTEKKARRVCSSPRKSERAREEFEMFLAFLCMPEPWPDGPASLANQHAFFFPMLGKKNEECVKKVTNPLAPRISPIE